MNDQNIPPFLQDELQRAADRYSASAATTNAGRILRFIAMFIPVSTVVKLFAYKLKK